MRLWVFIALLIAPATFAQHGGSHGAAPGHFAPRHAPPPFVPHTHAPGAVIVPYPVFYGGYYGAPYAPDPAGYGPGVAPGYAQDYSQGYAPGYDAGYGADPYQQGAQPPVVILNQGYAPEQINPQLRDYSHTPLPPPGTVQVPPGSQQAQDDTPTVYLIAMKDHTIFPAVAYWMEGDILNYVTTEGTSVNRVSLSLVDRDFSQQLNDQRNVAFKLPAPR